MRKFNTVLVLLIMLLLLYHTIFGSLHLFGIGPGSLKKLAFAMLMLVMAHAVVSMIVTVRAEKAGISTKARYNKEYRAFWGRRISGMLVAVFALIHAYTMFRDKNGVPRIARLPKFLNLATPLLIFFVYLHILTNVRPLLISLGVRNIDRKEKVIKAALTVVMLFGMSAVVSVIVSHMGGH